MHISKQTMKNRLHLLLKAETIMIKWVKAGIFAQRTQTFRPQKGECTEANLQATEK